MLYERFDLVPVMQMNFIPKDEVLTYLKSLGASILEVRCGKFDFGEVESATYFVTKPG